MATKIWVRLEHGWGWHQKKCETNTGGTRAEQWNRFQACPCYRIWKEWAYMNVDDSAIPPLGLKYQQICMVLDKSKQNPRTNAEFPNTTYHARHRPDPDRGFNVQDDDQDDGARTRPLIHSLIHVRCHSMYKTASAVPLSLGPHRHRPAHISSPLFRTRKITRYHFHFHETS